MPLARPFRGFRFPPDVILWAVRWYLQFAVSFRDLELIPADRGVQVDHVTLYRWTQRFAPELEVRMRQHLRPCCGAWHVDETYVRIAGDWPISIVRSMTPVRPWISCLAPNETCMLRGVSFAAHWIGATRRVRALSSPTGSAATAVRFARW